MYVVLDFPESQETEAVPFSWVESFLEDNLEVTYKCYWPTDFQRALRNNDRPDKLNWKPYPVRILGRYGKDFWRQKYFKWTFHFI